MVSLKEYKNLTSSLSLTESIVYYKLYLSQRFQGLRNCCKANLICIYIPSYILYTIQLTAVYGKALILLFLYLYKRFYAPGFRLIIDLLCNRSWTINSQVENNYFLYSREIGFSMLRDLFKIFRHSWQVGLGLKKKIESGIWYILCVQA